MSYRYYIMAHLTGNGWQKTMDIAKSTGIPYQQTYAALVRMLDAREVISKEVGSELYWHQLIDWWTPLDEALDIITRRRLHASA